MAAPPLFGKGMLCLSSLAFCAVTAFTNLLIARKSYNTVAAENWTLVGGVRPDGATFRIRIPGTSSKPTQLLVSTSPPQGDGDSVDVTLPVDGGSYLVHSVTATGLSSETKYHYWTVDQDGAVLQRGHFKTPAREGSRFDFRIAAGGCSATGSKHSVFDHIAEEDPLLFVHLGDMHYEDIDADDVGVRIGAYDMVLGSPSIANLFSKTSLVAQWDDHDWLGNDRLGYCPREPTACQGRAAALEGYRIGLPYYDPLPSGSSPASIGATYQAFTVGTVRFIVSDFRSGTSDASIYGSEQKAWLFSELSNASAYDFVVWVTPMPWVGDSDWVGWSHFPEDRSELSDFITRTLGGPGGPQNLLAISADAHMLGFDDGRNTYYGTSAAPSPDVMSFPILMSGPLDRFGTTKGGPFSDGCWTRRWERSNQYSTLDFAFDEEGGACVEINAYRVGRFSDREAVLGKRLCGKIFRATDTVGTGSCDSPIFSTESQVVFGASGMLCLTALAVACRFLGRRDALAASFILLSSGVSICAVGVYVPLRATRNAGDGEVLLTAILCAAYTLMVVVYLILWGRRKKRDDAVRETDGSVVAE